MTPEKLRDLLERVRSEKTTVDEAIKNLQLQPFEDIPNARVDSHRALRCGFPEVIFCQNKRAIEITAIARTILKRSPYLLATRADRAAFNALRKASSKAVYHAQARCVTVEKKKPPRHDGRVLIVVVAGMEGALASVVGGLTDVPVIAVPTSVGYGASLGGIAPLLTMLNSCAAGVAVVNIDNGFGAGHMAALIARRRTRK